MGALLRWVASVPPLRRPVLIVALQGFVDAGGVGETAAMFLRHRWQAERVAAFDRDAFIDYRARRPTAVVDRGRLRRVDYPDIELLAATTDGERDVVLLLGPEPDMRWEAFIEEVADAATQLGVEETVGLAAYPAAVPHTRPVRVVRAAAGEQTDVSFPAAAPVAGYTGPVGAATALEEALAQRGLRCIGLWAEVPHYIAVSPYPEAALTLVHLVADAVGTHLDTAELEAAARHQREQIDRAVSQHEEAAEIVAVLERHVDTGGDEASVPDGDQIAAEIERFLRNQ